MNVYKVAFIETLGKNTFSTFVNVRAKSKQEAEDRVKRTQRNLAKTYYGGVPPEIIILGTSKVGSKDEQVLDRLWDIKRDLYYELWEPDIPTRQMIRKLITQYPGIYKKLGG